ncbi:rRNA maturation RNase YbeY [uncultured Rhodoblastus sp.]|uniref:rRNA maturation RNase YbeY n=1 Tax=uncultured Rhodoblastus sp. TaxID=543037 RepID=UPI0025FB4FBB|nr:rRNA maturation RNase YbeY [uncultured Rhodoblastus sp.]
MSRTANLAIEIRIDCVGWSAVQGIDALVAGSLQAAIEESGDAFAQGAEVSLLFCDDAAIRELNRRFRGQDKPTNVLSFPGPDPIETATFLGDIAIARETVAREALEQGRSLEQHCRHMIVHGFLHLLGYDHEAEEEAEAMEAMEIRILRKLGVDDPYREDRRKETIDHERA